MRSKDNEDAWLDEIATLSGCSEGIAKFLFCAMFIGVSALHLTGGEPVTALTDALLGTSLLAILSINDVERLKVLPLSLLVVIVREIAQHIEAKGVFFDYNPFLFAGFLVQLAITIRSQSKNVRT